MERSMERDLRIGDQLAELISERCADPVAVAARVLGAVCVEHDVPLALGLAMGAASAVVERSGGTLIPADEFEVVGSEDDDEGEEAA